MSYDLVVRGGRVVSASGVFDADVAVAGGRIAAVGGGIAPGARELDASGLYVIPGAVDGHVHLNDPTFPPLRDVHRRRFRDRHAGGSVRRRDDRDRLRPAGGRPAAARWP